MWILIISILIDQVSKYMVSGMSESLTIIPGILSFEYVQNHGAVFGIMQGSNYIMAIISAILCLIISANIIKSKRDSQNVHFAWYMILSGGIGNLIDRLFRGYVVDFIATPFIATFNIADSVVVIGVGLLILSEVVELIKEKRISSKE